MTDTLALSRACVFGPLVEEMVFLQFERVTYDEEYDGEMEDSEVGVDIDMVVDEIEDKIERLSKVLGLEQAEIADRVANELKARVEAGQYG